MTMYMWLYFVFARNVNEWDVLLDSFYRCSGVRGRIEDVKWLWFNSEGLWFNLEIVMVGRNIELYFYINVEKVITGLLYRLECLKLKFMLSHNLQS
jgi:hypothetical protein